MAEVVTRTTVVATRAAHSAEGARVSGHPGRGARADGSV